MGNQNLVVTFHKRLHGSIGLTGPGRGAGYVCESCGRIRIGKPGGEIVTRLSDIEKHTSRNNPNINPIIPIQPIIVVSIFFSIN